jgi:hypothetical protein
MANLHRVLRVWDVNDATGCPFFRFAARLARRAGKREEMLGLGYPGLRIAAPWATDISPRLRLLIRLASLGGETMQDEDHWQEDWGPEGGAIKG